LNYRILSSSAAAREHMGLGLKASAEPSEGEKEKTEK
jgi:hypothetical protein